MILRRSGGAGVSRREGVAGAPKADRRLTESEQEEWQRVLREMTADRTAIGRAMVWAIGKADAAAEIVDILVQSMTIAETPPAAKLARFYACSDILYNAGAKARRGRAYHALLQGRLPEVMAGFNELLLSLEGRITQENLKKRVLAVLRSWGEWLVFSEDFIVGLEVTFLRGCHPSMGSSLPASDASRLRNYVRSLSDTQLATRCRHCGLDSSGERDRLIARILLHEDRKRERNPLSHPS